MISYLFDLVLITYKMLIVILAFQGLVSLEKDQNHKEYIKWKKETLGI